MYSEVSLNQTTVRFNMIHWLQHSMILTYMWIRPFNLHSCLCISIYTILHSF